METYSFPPLEIPPVLQNITWLDFDVQKDCSIASRALSEWIMADGSHTPSIILSSIPSLRYALFDFAKTCSPVSLTNISDGQIWDWNSYHEFYHGVTVLNLTNNVNENCHLEFYQSLGWTGDPDLSGPGVMAAYIIQLVFASGFMAFYLVVEIAKWTSPQLHRKDDVVVRLTCFIQSAIPHVNRCFDVFWLSSLYFSLAISVATYFLTFSLDGANRKLAVRYLISFSFLGTVFSWAVTMSLFHWGTREGTTAPPGGYLLFVTSFAFSFTVCFYSVAAYYRASVDPCWSTARYRHFETFCLASLETYRGFTFFMFFAIPCICAPWIAVLGRFLIGRIFKLEPTRRLRGTVVPLVNEIYRLYCFMIMWTSLAFFLKLRSDSSRLLENSQDGDNEWGFGQMIAVLG